jgi:undecaprenyl pyrophosphate phosphatase UppP
VPEGLTSAMLIGVTAAAITGWLAITGLQRLAARSDFNMFVVYRVALGIAVLGVVATGLR